jgi:hypothetical protein
MPEVRPRPQLSMLWYTPASKANASIQVDDTPGSQRRSLVHDKMPVNRLHELDSAEVLTALHL